MSTNTSVDHPFLKAGTALGGAAFAQTATSANAPTAILFGVPVATMADIAALFAATYTLCLMLEFVWRKFVRPFAEGRKWLKPKHRRKTDQDFHDRYGV